MLEVLAGIPSVVFGFFALRVLGPDLIQPLFDTPQTTSLLVDRRRASASSSLR